MLSGGFAAATVLCTKLTRYFGLFSAVQSPNCDGGVRRQKFRVCALYLSRNPHPFFMHAVANPRLLMVNFFRHAQAKLICVPSEILSLNWRRGQHILPKHWFCLPESTASHPIKPSSYFTTLHLKNNHRCTIQPCSQILNKILIIRYLSRYFVFYNSETNSRIFYLCSKFSPYNKYTLFEQ